MKRVLLIFSLFVVSIFDSHAQEYCDTLKWKTIQTCYTRFDGSYFYDIGNLDNAVINIDTLSEFFPGIDIVNISNDTFFENEKFAIASSLSFYADTGFIGTTGWVGFAYSFGKDYFPNDTLRIGVHIKTDLLALINNIKEQIGIELEQISYWQMIIGVMRTSKDGNCSDSVFYAGANTSIFRVVRGGVGIQEKENTQRVVSVYPNPAQTQFTVTNTENTDIQLFTVLGQKVLQTYGKEENTVIHTASLPQGMYVLKVVKDNSSFVHKVQVVR